MARPTKRTPSGEIIIPEANVQSMIIKFLNRAGIPNNRVNGAQFTASGTNKRGNSSTRRIRCNSMNGKADVEAWTYITNGKTKIGVTLYIEVKRSHGGKQSDDQKKFQEMLENNGHFYVVARSIEDVVDFMSRVKSFIEEEMVGWTLNTGRAKLDYKKDK